MEQAGIITQDEVDEILSVVPGGNWWSRMTIAHQRAGTNKTLKDAILKDFLAWTQLGLFIASVAFLNLVGFMNVFGTKSIEDLATLITASMKMRALQSLVEALMKIIYTSSFMYAAVTAIKGVVAGTFKYFLFVSVPPGHVPGMIARYLHNPNLVSKRAGELKLTKVELRSIHMDHMSPIFTSILAVIFGTAFAVTLAYGLLVSLPLWYMLYNLNCWFNGTKRIIWQTANENMSNQTRNRWIHGRYRLMENRAEHTSDTCAVYRAFDMLDGKTNLALKFMRIKAHFRRELESRKYGFDQDYVVPIVESFPPANNLSAWPDEVSKDFESTDFNLPEQAQKFFCIAMPLGDKNLYTVLKSERWAGGRNVAKIRSAFTQLCECVQHMHGKGVVHADCKPLNFIRRDADWYVIDLDAACSIERGDSVGFKSSSAYCPPELIGVRNRVKRGGEGPAADQQIAFVKSEGVLAHPSFDVWSLGCILCTSCATRMCDPCFREAKTTTCRATRGTRTLCGRCATGGESRTRSCLRLATPWRAISSR